MGHGRFLSRYLPAAARERSAPEAGFRTCRDRAEEATRLSVCRFYNADSVEGVVVARLRKRLIQQRIQEGVWTQVRS
jgi:hypothetical protein